MTEKGDDEAGLVHDDSGHVHVYPLFGREHVAGLDCWCEPVQDDYDPHVYIHQAEQ